MATTNLNDRVSAAIRRFWRTRRQQGRQQGTKSGRKDYGNRAVATGGKQLEGFSELVSDLLVEAGLPRSAIYSAGREDVTLPGFFRPTKQWDLVVVHKGTLLASVEFKALCGPSFGNNYNNRVEEALGNATDLWTAYRERAFQASPRPMLAYMLLLEEDEKSTRQVDVVQRHFPVFNEFRNASYAKRCEESLRRLLRERCYDTTCLLLSRRSNGARGIFREPAEDLTFDRFVKTLCNYVEVIHRSLS